MVPRSLFKGPAAGSPGLHTSLCVALFGIRCCSRYLRIPHTVTYRYRFICCFLPHFALRSFLKPEASKCCRFLPGMGSVDDGAGTVLRHAASEGFPRMELSNLGCQTGAGSDMDSFRLGFTILASSRRWPSGWHANIPACAAEHPPVRLVERLRNATASPLLAGQRPSSFPPSSPLLCHWAELLDLVALATISLMQVIQFGAVASESRSILVQVVDGQQSGPGWAADP